MLLSIFSYGLLAGCLWYLGSSLIGYAIDGDHVRDSFLMLRKMRITPTFADLKWITVIGECGTKFQTIYQSAAASCATYGYGMHGGGYPESGYPPMATWLLRWMQFPARQSAALAVLGGVAFVTVLLVFSKGLLQSGWEWPLWLSIILVSFPVQLVLERGNLDILIFLILTATAACISMSNRTSWLPSGLLALLAVSLKTYPVTGFVGWLAFGPVAESHGSRVSQPVKAAVLSGCVIGLVLSLPWMFGSVNLEAPGGMNSYGLRAWGNINVHLVRQIGVASASLVIRSLIILKLTALVIGVALAVRFRLNSALQNLFEAIEEGFFRRFSQAFFLLASWTWLGCYILTISFDYRHIFMLPSLFILLRMVNHCPGLRSCQYVLAWILVAASVVFILFPLAHYNGLTYFTTVSRFCELAIEFLLIPLYAGALAVMLTGYRLKKIPILSFLRD